MKARHLSAYLQQLLDKYKYILLVLLVGLILLLWPLLPPGKNLLRWKDAWKRCCQ